MPPDLYEAHGAWQAFDVRLVGRISSRTTEPVCRKLVLPASQADHLLKLLWDERIGRAHLMPTLDNVTASLRVKWRWG